MPVKTNEVLYRIQQALNLTPEEMLEAYALAEYPMTRERLEALLKLQQDKDTLPCSYEELGVFLDGLILLRRGPSPKKNENNETVELTNNLILKKLRIALELKEPETELIFNLGDAILSKQELKSLFRNENHKNFKYCPDALLEAFLEGLEEYNYVPETE